MKNLSKSFAINLITWAVILAAALFAVCVFNKLIAAKSAVAIFRVQNIASAKIIPATDAKTMPEQTFDIQNDNVFSNIDNEEKTENNEIAETEENIETKAEELAQEEPVVEMTPEEQQQAKNKELCDAVEAGDLEEVKQALENGANANSGCATYNPPDCITYTFDGRFDSSALIEAIQKNNYEIVKTLLEHGASINGFLGNNCDNPDEYPIDSAIRTNNTRLIELLLDKGANLLEIIQYRKYLSLSKDTIKYLVERGVLLSNFMDDKPFVEYLLSKGAPPTLCYMENIEDFKWMLSKGGDLKKECVIFSTFGAPKEYGPLIDHYAGINGNIEIFKFLLENGAKITPRTKDNANFYKNLIGVKIVIYIDSISEQQSQKNEQQEAQQK
jgi:hypothetical protein